MEELPPDPTLPGDDRLKPSRVSESHPSSMHSGKETAPHGSLDPQVVQDIRLLREFDSNRQRQMARLFGRRLRQSPLRDELLRLIMLAFAEGRNHRVAFYVRACAVFATDPSVRSEMHNLVASGLIVLTRDDMHPKTSVVKPTQKLVAFYNGQMRRLREEVILLVKASAAQESAGPGVEPESKQA